MSRYPFVSFLSFVLVIAVLALMPFDTDTRPQSGVASVESAPAVTPFPDRKVGTSLSGGVQGSHDLVPEVSGQSAVVAAVPAPQPTPVATATAATPAKRKASATKSATKRPAAKKSARSKAPARKGATRKAAAKPKRPAAPKHLSTIRTQPGAVSMGHYLRSLTGRPRDRAAMYGLGTHDALRNRGNRYSMVLLDIGGQVHGGVRLSATTRFVSYSALRAAMAAYIDGYARHRNPHVVSVIALGTNNDIAVSRATGAIWATQVVEPLRRRYARVANLSVIGANDFEPGFSASVGASHQWLAGYLQATKAQLLFNGSADGCSPNTMASHCNHGWTARQIAWLAGLAAPSRILVLPQIYNRTMAWQWAQIARTAVAYGHRRLQIIGPLTETAACGGDPSCPTMASKHAWGVLWGALRSRRSTGVGSLPVQTDLDIR